MLRKSGVLLGMLVLSLLGVVQAQEFAGAWMGEASLGSDATRIRVNIEDADGSYSADVDLLDIGVTGWPAIEVERSDDGFVVTIPSDSGPQQLTLGYTGETSVQGQWTESRDVAPASLQLEHTGAIASLSETRTSLPGPAGVLGVSVILPEQGPARAGVVFVHGSGSQPRDTSRFDAQMFAEAGFATAFYDKRGVGESDGDWLQADFNDLAEDAAMVAAHLEALTGLPPERIGFVGTSQGGWISPLAVARRSGEGFVISIAGPATTPAEEGMWNAVLSLRQAGYGEAVEVQVRSILEDWNNGVRSGGDFTVFEARRAAVADEPWFEASLLMNYPTQDLSAEWFGWYQAVLDFDPVPVIRGNNAPFLSLMGDKDEEQPWDRSQQLFERLNGQGHPVEVHVYENVNHAMRQTGDGTQAPRWPSRPSDFYQRQFDFIDRALSE